MVAELVEAGQLTDPLMRLWLAGLDAGLGTVCLQGDAQLCQSPHLAAEHDGQSLSVELAALPQVAGRRVISLAVGSRALKKRRNRIRLGFDWRSLEPLPGAFTRQRLCNASAWPIVKVPTAPARVGACGQRRHVCGDARQCDDRRIRRAEALGKRIEDPASGHELVGTLLVDQDGRRADASQRSIAVAMDGRYQALDAQRLFEHPAAGSQ